MLQWLKHHLPDLHDGTFVRHPSWGRPVFLDPPRRPLTCRGCLRSVFLKAWGPSSERGSPWSVHPFQRVGFCAPGFVSPKGGSLQRTELQLEGCLKATPNTARGAWFRARAKQHELVDPQVSRPVERIPLAGLMSKVMCFFDGTCHPVGCFNGKHQFAVPIFCGHRSEHTFQQDPAALVPAQKNPSTRVAFEGVSFLRGCLNHHTLVHSPFFQPPGPFCQGPKADQWLCWRAWWSCPKATSVHRMGGFFGLGNERWQNIASRCLFHALCPKTSNSD